MGFAGILCFALRTVCGAGGGHALPKDIVLVMVQDNRVAHSTRSVRE